MKDATSAFVRTVIAMLRTRDGRVRAGRCRANQLLQTSRHCMSSIIVKSTGRNAGESLDKRSVRTMHTQGLKATEHVI